jgi:hypothetical protein
LTISGADIAPGSGSAEPRSINRILLYVVCQRCPASGLRALRRCDEVCGQAAERPASSGSPGVPLLYMQPGDLGRGLAIDIGSTQLGLPKEFSIAAGSALFCKLCNSEQRSGTRTDHSTFVTAAASRRQ